MYVVPEEDYLAHYGRKGMKWYQHIFGGEEARRARAERKVEKQKAKLDKKGEKIAKWEKKFDKNLEKRTRIGPMGGPIFFKNFRNRRAEHKCVMAMEKILRTGMIMGDSRMTKQAEYGREVLDKVLKKKGGYAFVWNSYNRHILNKIMNRAAGTL